MKSPNPPVPGVHKPILHPQEFSQVWRKTESPPEFSSLWEKFSSLSLRAFPSSQKSSSWCPEQAGFYLKTTLSHFLRPRGDLCLDLSFPVQRGNLEIEDYEGNIEVQRHSEGSGHGARWETEEMTELNSLADVPSYCFSCWQECRG